MDVPVNGDLADEVVGLQRRTGLSTAIEVPFQCTVCREVPSAFKMVDMHIQHYAKSLPYGDNICTCIEKLNETCYEHILMDRLAELRQKLIDVNTVYNQHLQYHPKDRDTRTQRHGVVFNNAELDSNYSTQESQTRDARPVNVQRCYCYLVKTMERQINTYIQQLEDLKSLLELKEGGTTLNCCIIQSEFAKTGEVKALFEANIRWCQEIETSLPEHLKLHKSARDSGIDDSPTSSARASGFEVSSTSAGRDSGIDVTSTDPALSTVDPGSQPH
ncbi:uncharacterized protein LOC131952448 [Physella acuta]|uniref:uncharacterized protein LOC131952448 n=1 Tax=Physella acuta TaxID=109671 RepID=UPI0027DC3F0A|nr:uncharacterized protein LOC131952448 [Physella acuta]XP_059171205.1 uncharacterized protein LOC131952448 [Physella acuta]